MQPLRVGLLTSWNTRCGIAEYSRYIAERLRDDERIDLTVLGSANTGRHKLSDDESWVLPVFQIPFMNDGADVFDTDRILSLDLDVLHIQYQQHLYNTAALHDLIDRFDGQLIVTYHDNCFPDDFPAGKFAVRYTHRDGVGRGEMTRIPLGVEDHIPVVKTFGLGRCRHDIIADVCDRNGWQFDKFFGGQTDEWLTQEDLRLWLRDSDMIVLWYDESAAAGSSSAARIAMSSRRPVIVNDTSWFADLPADARPHLRKVSTPAQLESEMRDVLDCELLTRDSWQRVVARHTADYLTAAGRGPVPAPDWQQDSAAGDCDVRIQPVPAIGPAGQRSVQQLTFAVHNRTGRPLATDAADPVRVTARLHDETGAAVAEQRADLDVIVPGARALVTVALEMPDAGRYELHVTLTDPVRGDYDTHDPQACLRQPLNVLVLHGAPVQKPRTMISPDARATLLSVTMPAAGRRGGQLPAQITLTNAGREPLYSAAPAPVMIGYRFYDAATGNLVGEGPQIPLPAYVAAGARETVDALLSVPGPGAYLISVELVQAGEWWGSGQLNAHRQIVIIDS